MIVQSSYINIYVHCINTYSIVQFIYRQIVQTVNFSAILLIHTCAGLVAPYTLDIVNVESMCLVIKTAKV